MKCLSYQIGEHKFTSQKDALQYVRDLLSKIGICQSIKNETKHYSDIYTLVQNHPDFIAKCKNLHDFRIIKNKLNKNALELNIINEDGSIEDISWHSCVTGKPKTYKQELLSALRYSIDYQIKNYKDNVLFYKCMLCDKECSKDFHIDHIIHFDKLVKDFHKSINIVPPNEFDNADDNTNRRKIKSIDRAYKKMWQEYHLQNAILRVTCKTCNLKRPKYK